MAWNGVSQIRPSAPEQTSYTRVEGVNDRYQDYYLQKQRDNDVRSAPVSWKNFNQKAALWDAGYTEMVDTYARLGRAGNLADVDSYVRALRGMDSRSREQAKSMSDFLRENQDEAIGKLGVAEYEKILSALNTGYVDARELDEMAVEIQDYLGDLAYQQRQEKQEEEKKGFWASVWDYLTSDTAGPGQIVDSYREWRDAAKETADWPGRQALIDEYRKYEDMLNATDGGNGDARARKLYGMSRDEILSKRDEVRATLEERDRDYGNGQRTYSWQDKLNSVITGTGEIIAGNVGKAGVMIGDLVSKRMANDADYLAAVMQAEDYDAMFEPEVVRQFAGREVRSEEERAKWQEYYKAVGKLGESGQAAVDRARNGLGPLGQAGVDIAENLLEMGFDAVSGGALGVGSLVPMFIRVLGESGYRALQEGATLEEALAYGGASAGIELFTEKLHDGVAGIYGAGMADELSDTIISRLSGSSAGQFIMRFFNDAISEGNEEVLSDYLQPLAEKIRSDRSLKELYGEVNAVDVVTDWLLGTAVGLVGSATSTVTGQYGEAARRDQALMDIYARMGETPSFRQEVIDRGLLTEVQRTGTPTSGRGEDRITEGEGRKSVRQDAAEGMDALSGREKPKTGPSRAVALLDANRAAVVDAVEREISGRGEDVVGEVRSLANAIVSDVRGDRMSENQKKTIEKNKTLAQAIESELTGKDKAQWARDVLLYGRKALLPGFMQDRINEAEAAYSAKSVLATEADGEEGMIVGVKKDDAGEITGYEVQTESGVKEIGSDEAGLTKAQQKVAELLTGGEYAGEKIENLGDGQNAAAYADDFDIVADVFGFSNEYENADDAWNALEQAGRTTDLTREQFKAAFDAGKARISSGLKATLLEKGSGKVSFESYRDGDTEYAAPTEDEIRVFEGTARYDVLQRVAKAAGVDLVFFKAPKSAVNGQYLNGKVYINMDAAPRTSAELGSYTMQTAAHELTHYLREKDPARYVDLKDFVVKKLIETGKLEDGRTLFELIRDKRALYEQHGQTMTIDGVLEEVVADASEMVLKDNQTLTEVKKENAKLSRSIRDYMRNFVLKLTEAFTGVEATKAEAKAMQKYLGEMQKIWSAGVFGEGEAATQANENAAQESGGKYSLKEIEIPTREELETKPDIPVVDIREETSGSYKEQRAEFLNSEEVRALYKEPAINRDTNEPLFIIPASITHTFSNRGQENILLAKHIREIAENAVLTHGEPSRDAPRDHTTGVYKFFGAVQTDAGIQPVKLTVKEYNVEGQDIPKAILDIKNGIDFGDTYATLYDGKVLVLESVEKETSSSAPSPPVDTGLDKHPSVSEISIKDLLNLVKGEDAKYIPQHEHKAENGKKSLKEWDGVEEEAVRHFGTTDDFRIAGYLMQDGRMLDFSGAHWLDGYDEAYIANWRKKNDIRQVDHEDIYEAFEEIDADNAPNDSGLAFIKRGNIRIVTESPGIELYEKVEPTAAQYRQLKDYIRTVAEDSQHYNSEHFIVDLTKDRTHHAGTLRYDGKLNADRIVNDIKHYYQTGEIREQSTVDRFRFSLKDEDAVSDRELLANTPLEAARNDGELRRLGDYKKQLDVFFTAQDELGAAEEKLTEAWHSGDRAAIRAAQRERDRASAQLSRADGKLREIRETRPIQMLLEHVQGDSGTRQAAAASEDRAEKQRSYKQLQADNRALREQVDRLRRELRPTKDRSVRRSDARRIAKEILEGVGTEVSVNELTDVIERMGNYLVQTATDELDDRTLFRQAGEIAREIVDSTSMPAETGMEEIHDKLKSYLRGTKLQIGKEYVKDLGQETLAMWRSINPGVSVSTESGTPVDSAYGELQEMLGEGVLPAGVTHPADQLNLISGLLQDSGREQFYNPYRGYETETAARIANDIVSAVYSEALRQTAPTMADRMKNMQEKNRARIADIKRDSQARIQEVRARERAQKWAKVDAVREYYRTKEAKARESRRSSELRQKIRKLHGEMSNDLLKPRKDHYVPETLRKPIAELLEAVNTDSGRSVRLKDAVEQLNVQYRKIAETWEGSYAFDQGVADMLQKLHDMLVEKGGDTSIFNMSKDELGLVYNTMRAVNHTLRTAVKLINYETEKNIFQIARGMMDETRQAAPKGVGVKVLDDAYDRWLSASMRPETFFRRLAGYRKGSNWEMMADMLNSAQLKQTRLQMEGAAIFEELMRDTKALDAMTDRKKLIDIGLRDADGNAVKVTKDMALMLYLHTLNEDNTRHLVYGGLTVPDMRQYYGGKASVAYGKGSVRVFGFGEELSELSRDLRHAESEEDRQEAEARIRDAEARAKTWVRDLQNSIMRQMGDYEKAWIKAAQRFFNDFSQKTLNETTKTVYGFEKATVENYAPIHTDPAYRQAEFESIARDISLENSGFMKERILNAKNPMLAEGLVDVVSTQIDSVAKYAAMMPAVRNFQKVYGKTRTGFTDSVQAGVRQYFGNNALKYIENIMTDLTSPRRTEGGMLGEFADRLRGNLAAASLTLNPRVALGQASSYPTAAAVVGWKPLVKAFGLGKNPMRDAQARQEIARWSPLMWYRMQGFFDRDVGDLHSRKGATARISDRLSFLTNWIELMDGATVGRLWYAAQAYVADITELERGSDEFMQESAKVFNRIVERTQPNYTTFQRPDILRNPNAIVKHLVMFMTQRLQNANVLYDAVGTYNAAVRDRRAGKNGVTDADIKEAQQGLTRAVTSQLAATASITVFKLLADALMYSMKAYRDDDDELTKESVLKKLLLNMSESAASNFLWGAELYDAASKVITGDKYYGVSLNGVESFTDAAKTLVNTLQYFTGDGKTQEKTLKQLEYLAKDAGQLLGIPYANSEKFVKAVMNRVNDVREGNGWGSFMSEIELTDERRAKMLYRALESGDKDAAQKQYETFGEKADANKALQKYIREAYKAGNMSDEEARKALQEYADMSRYDSEASIGRLKLEVDHGVKYDELKEQYVSGEISREEAIDWQVEYGSEKRHNVEKEVRRWDCEKETGYEYDKLQDYVAAGDITEDQAVEYRVKYGGQEEPDAIADVAKWMCEIETGIPYDSIQEYYANGWIDRETLIEDYKQYGLMDDELAERVANKRDFIGLDYDLNDISLSASDDYYKYAAGLGVDKHLYYDAWKQGNAIHADYNSNGKAIAYSAMDKKLRYIDSLPLDNEQKTAIALCYGISSKNINSRAPWKKR